MSRDASLGYSVTVRDCQLSFSLRLCLSNPFPRETLREVLHLLRSTGNTQVEYIIRIMKKWAKENRVPI